MAYSDTSPLDGQSQATRAQAVAFLIGRKVAADLAAAIAGYYWDRCALAGLDPALALAQSVHETTNVATGVPFASWWASRPRCNMAGVGVTGESRPHAADGAADWQHQPDDGRDYRGYAFGSYDRGVLAHVVHLAAYRWAAGQEPAGIRPLMTAAVDPRLPALAGRRGIARTPRDLNGKWAVPGTTYGASIARVAEAIRQTSGGTNMGHVPRPPIKDRLIGIPPKVAGVGADWGAKREPKFSVVHSMVGTLWGTDGYFRQPATQGLTDFGIGITDVGGGFAEILQWCDPFGTLIPWASGPVRDPEGDGPRALAAFGGAGGVNRHGVSIELDDRGDVNTPVSAAQWSSLVWMLAYVHAEWLGQTADTFDWNLHHHEFCGDGYKKCPFGRVRNFTLAYQEAVKAIMRHFQEGGPYPAGGLWVNGKKLALPPEGAVAPTPTPVPTPGPAPTKPPWTYDQAQAYRRKYIMDTAEAMPARLRGPLVREGWVDLTGVAPGAVADERWAQFEKIRLHTIGTGPGGGRVEAFALEGPHSFEALKAAGKLGEF